MQELGLVNQRHSMQTLNQEQREWKIILILMAKLDSKEIKPVNLKEVNPEYSLEGLMLKLKLQNFDHLMRRANSLEKILMLGKTEGRRRRG